MFLDDLQANTHAVLFAHRQPCPEKFVCETMQHLSNMQSASCLYEIIFVIYFNDLFEDRTPLVACVLATRAPSCAFEVHSFSIEKESSFFQKKSQYNTITVNFDVSFFNEIKEKITKKYQENQEKIILKNKEAFFLEPVFIPKPWGQEIWYTGIEKRGVSLAKSVGSFFSVPISWIFSAFPKMFMGEPFAHQNLVLVKVLDPFVDKIYGDLYYELHLEKNEVYVVTDISVPQGQIKIGINPEKLISYQNDLEKLKLDFLNSIQSYEKIRRKIDALLDGFRVEERIPLCDPLPPMKAKLWEEKIPRDLQQEEVRLRKEMEAFSGFLNLNVGDVVCVPIHVPHALQHGVRVVEFQTPTYERLVISFAQKVLTQTHWDTLKAFECMKLDVAQKTQLQVLCENDSFKEELVCSFCEFIATRIKLASEKNYVLEEKIFYQILFVVAGSIFVTTNFGVISAEAGSCLFLPAKTKISIGCTNHSVFLLCFPR